MFISTTVASTGTACSGVGVRFSRRWSANIPASAKLSRRRVASSDAIAERASHRLARVHLRRRAEGNGVGRAAGRGFGCPDGAGRARRPCQSRPAASTGRLSSHPESDGDTPASGVGRVQSASLHDVATGFHDRSRLAKRARRFERAELALRVGSVCAAAAGGRSHLSEHRLHHSRDGMADRSRSGRLHALALADARGWPMRETPVCPYPPSSAFSA